MLLESFMPVQTLADGRTFLGVDRAQGEVKVLAPSNRMQAEAVLRRAPGVRPAAGAVVRFEAFSVAGGNSYPRGTVELTLGVDADEQVLNVPVDSGGSPVRLVVTVPPELAGQVTAGWRALNILHAVDGPAAPSVLRSGARDIHPAGAEIRAALLPADWSPPEVHVRDVQVGPDGLELRPGGEIWIRLAGLYQEISGVATVVDRPAGAVDPVLRVVYFKGPKLDVLVQSAIRAPADNLPFKAWSAERDGWLVLMLEPYRTSPAVRIRLTGVRAAE
ncbi:hypothetical protein Verru16b_02027 [Lacunisphaera limnophila]|uniref:Uncharacterized protein n=2 Tax=Lacunisphaera limnophila TaxID=1838286 RepID=A0A1D8AVM9_9BACT|nr:hypothetical protein Verru16b_02027 [Lacunisphaera limnophila]